MKKAGILLMIGVVLFSCKNNNENQNEKEMTDNEQASIGQNQNHEWQNLLENGLEDWKAYNAEEVSDQWQFEDSVLVFTPSEGDRPGSENLITKEEFTNFELSLEWKIAEGGNSGVMWGVQEDQKFSEPYLTGPEIQILDNERHPDAQNGTVRQAGALYDMVPPREDVTKPAGEWNEMQIRIDYDQNRGSVNLNGSKILTFPLHGEEWNELVEGSKFAEWEDFGKNRTGHIALQDHGDKVWFKNIKIKELD